MKAYVAVTDEGWFRFLGDLQKQLAGAAAAVHARGVEIDADLPEPFGIGSEVMMSVAEHGEDACADLRDMHARIGFDKDVGRSRRQPR